MKQYSDPDILKLISKMTTREKIGQMVQLSLSMFMNQETKKLDEAKLEYYINTYNIGSFMNNYNDKINIVPPDPEEWVNTINLIQSKYLKTKHKIPMIYGLDCIHGANYIYGATLFPQQLGLASSFNRDIIKSVGEITAKDTRAVGIHWNFSPVLDVAVNKQWSRVYETFGEDPYVCAELGKVMIFGYQGEFRNLSSNNKVAATMKHFIGYSGTYSGRDVDGSWISDRILYEYFKPPYEEAIKSLVATTMESYNDISGEHIVNSEKYLSNLLRKQMNFTGVLVTDWGQIEKLHIPIRVAESPKEAVRLTMKLGSIDMSMTPTSVTFIDYLEELINEQEISKESIDISVARILSLKKELGLFRDHGLVKDITLAKTIGSARDQEVSLEAAREGVILLKNKNNVLPLKKNSKIFVTGPISNNLRFLSGGWTFNWQGSENDSWFLNGNTIVDSIKKYSKSVISEDFVDIDGVSLNKSNKTIEELTTNEVDVFIVCLGEKNYAEIDGNIKDMNLPLGQLDLINKISHLGKPIILILSQGRPRSIGKISEKADAILNGFFLGPHSGEAFSDVLFGNYNPCGKLPITYANYPTGSYLNYYSRANEKYDPEWEFGFGLSYTTFTYTNLTLDKTILKNNEKINVSVCVKNTGKYRGKEVVMMFLTDIYRSISPERKRLRAFEKIDLIPNQIKNVYFTINVKDIAFYGADNMNRAEEGEFLITINSLSKSFFFEVEGAKKHIII